MQNIIYAVIGIIFTMTAATQVLPNMVPYIQSQKAQNLSEQEIAIFEAIKRYILVQGTIPIYTTNATIDPLVKKNLITSNMLTDNGWAKPISYSVDKTTGVVSMVTEVPTEDGRTAFNNTWKSFFKPVKSTTNNNMTTAFVIPTDILYGNASGIANGAVVSTDAPVASEHSFWYDTSAGVNSIPILKISDGTSWREAPKGDNGSGGWPAISSENLSDETNTLPQTGRIGEYRYIYNKATATIDTYVYYTNGWNLLTSINKKVGCMAADAIKVEINGIVISANTATSISSQTTNPLKITFTRDINSATMKPLINAVSTTLTTSDNKLFTTSLAKNNYTMKLPQTIAAATTNPVVNLCSDVIYTFTIK